MMTMFPDRHDCRQLTGAPAVLPASNFPNCASASALRVIGSGAVVQAASAEAISAMDSPRIGYLLII
jgi:hypothetical protein